MSKNETEGKEEVMKGYRGAEKKEEKKMWDGHENENLFGLPFTTNSISIEVVKTRCKII